MDISQITDYLYIASLLKSEDAEAIRARNVTLIINERQIRRFEQEWRTRYDIS